MTDAKWGKMDFCPQSACVCLWTEIHMSPIGIRRCVSPLLMRDCALSIAMATTAISPLADLPLFGSIACLLGLVLTTVLQLPAA